MKKFLLTIIAAGAALCANAGLPAGIFDHVGVGVGVGTTGISIEASTPITRWVQMRAGVAIMPGIKFNANVDADFDYSYGNYNDSYESEVELEGSLKRTQGYILFNIYPFPHGGFYVAAGAYFGGADLIKISGYSPELAERGGDVIIGDYVVPSHNGYVKGGLKVNSFRPYLGIGWGRAVPNHLLNFNIDLGVQIHGKPKVYTEYGEIDMTTLTDDDTFNKIMDKVKVYPTLTFKLGFRAY